MVGGSGHRQGLTAVAPLRNPPLSAGDGARGVIDLVDRLLQLGVEDIAVGDHDDRIEHRIIPMIVQHGEAVREP